MAAKKKVAALKSTGLPADYPVFLESLKSRVQQSQTKAMLSVNREFIQLYWDIGRLIVESQDVSVPTDSSVTARARIEACATWNHN